MAFRCFSVSSHYSGLTDLRMMLEILTLAEMQPTNQDLTRFLRLHGKSLRSNQDTWVFNNKKFLEINKKVKTNIMQLSAQSITDVLFWAKHVYESRVFNITDAIGDRNLVSMRIEELCTSNSFRTRQLIPLYSDAINLKLNLRPIEDKLVTVLGNFNEQFTPESLKQIFFTLIEVGPAALRRDLMELALKRWMEQKLDDINPGVVAGACGDLIKISKWIRSNVLDFAIEMSTEKVIPKITSLTDSDIRFILPSLILSDTTHTPLTSALLQYAISMIPHLTAQTRLSLLGISQKPRFQFFFQSSDITKILDFMTADLNVLTNESFESLMLMLQKVKRNLIPRELMMYIEQKVFQSKSLMMILAYGEMQSNYTEFLVKLETNMPLFEQKTSTSDIMATLAVINSRALPTFLKNYLKYCEASLKCAFMQKTELCILYVFRLENYSLNIERKFSRFYPILINCMERYFCPQRLSKWLEFLYIHMQNYYPECERVLTKHAGIAIDAMDVRLFVKELRKGERLSQVTEFLYLVKPVVDTEILSEAMKFELDDIPEKFNHMLMISLQPFMLNAEFLAYGYRVVNNPSASAKFLTRLANEIDAIKVLSNAQIRIATILKEKGFLNARQIENLKQSARLKKSSITNNALEEMCSPNSFNLEDLLDVVLFVAIKPDMSPEDEKSLLEPVCKCLPELPLAHSTRIFEQYNISETRDSVTVALLNALTPKLQKCDTPEVLLRYLIAASTVQWGSADFVSQALQIVCNAFSTLQPCEKLSVVSVLGQLACNDEKLWQPILDYYSSSLSLLQQNGAAVIYGLHQARLLSLQTWKSFTINYLNKAIPNPASLIGLELRKLMLALMSEDFYLLTRKVRGSIVTTLNTRLNNDFHSYLLYNWLETRPANVQLGSRKHHMQLAKEIGKKLVVQRLPVEVKEAIGEQNIALESPILGSGFYIPHYLPHLQIGLWPSSRAFSMTNKTLLGDFAILSESANAVKHTLKLVPNRFITDISSAQEWCRKEGLISN